MKRLSAIKLFTSFLLIHVILFIGAQSAAALSTIHLLKDNLFLDTKIWFESNSGIIESWHETYNGPTLFENGFQDFSHQINADFYEPQTGTHAQHLAVAEFNHSIWAGNEYFSAGTATGYYDYEQGFPYEEISGHAEASAILKWKFLVEGSDSIFDINCDPYGVTTVVNFLLYDETADQMIAEFNLLGQHDGMGDIALMDSHTYSLFGRSFTSGNGDPTSRFEMYFTNAVFEVPEPSGILLYATGLIILFSLSRKRQWRKFFFKFSHAEFSLTQSSNA